MHPPLSHPTFMIVNVAISIIIKISFQAHFIILVILTLVEGRLVDTPSAIEQTETERELGD